MSSSIWTRCAGASRLAPLRLSPWRVVEAQHLVSTRKLVDSIEEQIVLEQLIEVSKPVGPRARGGEGARVPAATGPDRHVLLTTPFRYPPLRHGSRFAGRFEPSLWYGSEDQRTVFAEAAYYRLVFLDGTRADLGTVATWHTAFTVQARTARGIDLTAQPFERHRAAISSPADYTTSQMLGSAMREAGVELFRYRSARDAAGGVNVGIFGPAVFGEARPRHFETWHATSTRDRVEFVRRDWRQDQRFTCSRSQFLVDGALPSPAV
jgi:RES domain